MHTPSGSMSQELFSNWPVSIIEDKGAEFEWRALNAHKVKHGEDTAHMPSPRSIAERKEGRKRILKRVVSGERSTRRNRDNRFNVAPGKPPNESCRVRDVPVNRRASTRAVPSSRAGNRPSLPSRSGSSTPPSVFGGFSGSSLEVFARARHGGANLSKGAR